MMNLTDVKEFRTTWNNELFQKNKSTVITAQRLIKKSLVIGKKKNNIICFKYLSLLSSNSIMSSVEIFGK